MFSVGDKVRINTNDSFDGDTGTVVLVTNGNGTGLDYIVDVDGNTDVDPFVMQITAMFGVPSSSVPFALEDLELVESNA